MPEAQVHSWDGVQQRAIGAFGFPSALTLALIDLTSRWKAILYNDDTAPFLHTREFWLEPFQFRTFAFGETLSYASHLTTPYRQTTRCRLSSVVLTMSSFKRRTNPASGSPAPATLSAGVKPSSFSSPVPLISTGVPALDDLLSGGGLSSSSDLLILPATGTSAQSAAQIGASSSTPSASSETDHAARAAAEPYVELLLGYSIAQGMASDHVGVVIGEDVRGLVGGLMARAGDLDEQLLKEIGAKSVANDDQEMAGPSGHLDTVNDDDDEAEAAPYKDAKRAVGSEANKPDDAQREREMKIAWRYHNMKQFNTTINEPSTGSSSSEPTPFCHTFDLSKRIDGRIVQHAIDQDRLEMVDISTASEASSSKRGVNSYEIAYKHIEAAAERCRQRAAAATSTAVAPVLRVAIRALGSTAWTVARGQSRNTETIRFLHRLKRLLRSLSLVETTDRSIPSIAVIGISPFLLSSATEANLAHRMVHSVDSAISMSAFAPSLALRTAFSAYTGALKVLKTPAVGTLTNPSIRSSVLRGMGTGAGASAGGKAAGGEGGAGGGENNLAFKVRRKRLVIETLHLDVEGGVSERRTKPPKGEVVAEVKGPSSRVEKSGGSSFAERQPATVAANTNASAAVKAAPAASKAAPPPTPNKFGGLSSLRQRGLAAAAAASAGQQQREYSVELDSTTRGYQHAHTNKPAPHIAKVANTRAEDLDF